MFIIMVIDIAMHYTRAFDTRIPELSERIHEFLKRKHLTGLVEYQFEPGSPSTPTGWVLLKVDIADPRLQEELNNYISNLEKFTLLLPQAGK